MYCDEALIDADGDGAADDYGQCVLSDLVVTQADLFTIPDPLKYFYYLVTGENADGEGSLGNSSNGTRRHSRNVCE